MRGADLGFAGLLCLAGVVVLVGLAIFPPGKAEGIYPTFTAWGPSALVVLGTLGFWATAAVILVTTFARPIPAGEVIFESDSGIVGLGLAFIPLAVGPLFLAGALDQIGRFGAHAAVWVLLLPRQIRLFSPRIKICPSLSAGEAKTFSCNSLSAKRSYFTPGFTTKSGGSGFGLFLARRIVEDQGGSLRLASGPGKGAIAELELPLTPARPAPASTGVRTE